jgi:hypothetical protein
MPCDLSIFVSTSICHLKRSNGKVMKKQKANPLCTSGNKVLKLFSAPGSLPIRQSGHLMNDYPMLEKAEAVKIIQELEEEYEHYYGD